MSTIGLRVAPIAILAAVFLAATTSAGALALRASGSDVLDADLSSRLSADYSADPRDIVFQPLAPEIIAAVERDSQPRRPSGPTSTPVSESNGNPPQAPVATRTATPTRDAGTATPRPATASAVSSPAASATPPNTAVPTATDTPRPKDTATPPREKTPIGSIDPVETVKPAPTQTPSPTATTTPTFTPRPTRTPAIAIDLPVATAIPCVELLLLQVCP